MDDELGEITKRLDTIIKLLALNSIQDIEVQIEKILRLSSFGLGPIEIATLLNVDIKNILEELLESDRDKLIYHFSDGEHGIREIMPKTGASYGYIQGIWQRWYNYQIAEKLPVGSGFRAKKLYLLEDLGIVIPELPSKTEKT